MAGFEAYGSGSTSLGGKPRGALVCTLIDGGSGESGMIFSVDGGRTWEQNTESLFTNDLSSPAYIQPRVVGGDFGFMTYNGNWARWSLRTGAQNAAY